MGSSEDKFKEILKKLDLKNEIITFEESTKTSQGAAEALGTAIANIGKSIVFKTKTGKFAIVVASGANRINEKIIERELKEPIVKTNGEEIRAYIGYPIGGIPPFGHDNPVIIFLDEDLKELNPIFCAGGTPNTIFKTNPQELGEITRGKWIKVK